ncbi:MAG TPA: GTP cyclohydrolase II [Kiloniellaceae bacterium]|nr:GTP cyclohydrolase II [Kiloniellaceae bacterium]
MPDSAVTKFKGHSQVLKVIDRALAELRRGAAVLIARDDGEAALVQAAEVVSDERLRHLAALAGTTPLLVLTRRRAEAIGIEAETIPQAGADDGVDSHVVALSLHDWSAARVKTIADPTAADAHCAEDADRVPVGDSFGTAAVELAKLARLLPAALIARLSFKTGETAAAWAREHDAILVSAGDIATYREACARALTKVAEARVPLAGAEKTKIIAFRPPDGGSEHMAMVIGDPDPSGPVLLRVHSECFTGDLLASLRCDCGDQLHGAIKAIGAEGAGLILYLTQEGRGIGLVNKLRAYALQDQGADTAVANETLGFDADERIYLPAAEMLRQLGFSRVRLLTNNPEKVEALTRCGIAVEERVPHSFPSNGHNAYYLATKARRFGHMI